MNAVLLKLSKDEDLHDDLKLPAVKAAIDHWTNRNRLDPEKAQLLQNNRRVIYVLQQFQLLQNVCHSAGMPVPLDHLLLRKSELEPSIINGYFKNKGTESSKSTEPVVAKERKEVKKSAPEKAATLEKIQPVDKVESLPASSEKKHVEPTVQAIKTAPTEPTESTGIHVNDVIKFFIALTVILIAVVLAQLFR